MLILKSAAYDRFRCIASRCTDSCCQAWDVEVDPETLERYQALTGELGTLVRRSLYEEDGHTYLGFEDGRCPLWRADGLCRGQAELGEPFLSRVCREFPRIHHDYGDFEEFGLELSCPEAARILLTEGPGPAVTQDVPGGEDPDYDQEAMALLKETRMEAIRLLEDRSRPIAETLILLLLWGCQVQSLLDGADVPDFDPEAILATAETMGQAGDFREIQDFFASLEILTPQWETLLAGPAEGSLDEKCRNLCLYFVGRYWLQAVSDYDIYCRVKFTVVACLLISRLGGDFVDTAHLFSKEIENDADNMDAILDAAYDHPCFADARLLGFLLEKDRISHL